VNSKNKNEVNKSIPSPSGLSLVNANTILQRALQKLKPEVRSNIVLRCDELPRVKITEECLENAFTELLSLIITNRSPDKKLFLHISSIQETETENDRHLNDGSNRYQVQFHSNTPPHTDWLPENQQQINSIAASLVPAGGSLVVNHLKNSGCIFCIALPGK
jgi:hypothetical protein